MNSASRQDLLAAHPRASGGHERMQVRYINNLALRTIVYLSKASI